jgi:DNA (cytosine-5)-methyltransferase 1
MTIPNKPRLLDLFCGAGGAAMGYRQAGFGDIVGVDINPQPHYPFEFVQGDALEYVAEHGHEFDAIHASPPCQAYVQRNKNLVTRHPKLIERVRSLLEGIPSVIENVEGAPLYSPIKLCGTMFDLPVRRHRLFEFSQSPPLLVPHCDHRGRTVASGDLAGVYAFGGKGHRHGRGIRDPKSSPGPRWADAMGIDWMTQAELTQAIPPAYTRYIGGELLASR